MSRQLVLSLVLLATALSASAGTYSTIEAIEYASPAGQRLLLDLRIPDGPGPHPVIVYLHSGAWISGDRTGGPAIRQASRGYAVASIDYRLAPKHIWPAQVEDAKAAVRWLRANAQRFRLDPDRIGIWGASSGGHIASVLGTSGGVAALEGLALGNPQFSSRVSVVVDFYGPTDLLRLEADKIPCIPLNGDSAYMPHSLLMGCPVQQCAEKARTASPMTYVTRDDPPFLIMQGMLDCLVSYKQSIALHEALEAGGVDSRLVLIPNGDHGGRVFNEPKYQQMVDDFLDTRLRGSIVVSKRRAVRR